MSKKLLVVGLAIRLAMAPFLAHPRDVFAWFAAGQGVISGTDRLTTFLVPYDYSFFLFVFPAILAYKFLSPLVPTFTFSTSTLPPGVNLGPRFDFVTVVPGLLFDLLVKIPLIVSDTLIAFILFKIVKERFGNERSANLAAAIWFLNPLTIWVSSGWGMFDTLPALFTVVALYFVLEERFELAGIAIVIASVAKYYAISLAIPVVLIAWKTTGRRRAASVVTLMAILLGVLLVPSITATLQGLSLLTVGGQEVGLHYSGLTFWTAITLFFPVDPTLLSSLALVALTSAVYLLVYRSWRSDPTKTILTFAVPVSASLLMYSFVGENFLVWLLPFLSLLAVDSKRTRYLLALVTVVGLISSMTNSLLPYYMLPVAPWFGSEIAAMLSFAAPYRVAPSGSVAAGFSIGKIALASLGVFTSILLLLLLITWLRSLTSDGSLGVENRQDQAQPGTPGTALQSHYLRAFGPAPTSRHKYPERGG